MEQVEPWIQGVSLRRCQRQRWCYQSGFGCCWWWWRHRREFPREIRWKWRPQCLGWFFRQRRCFRKEDELWGYCRISRFWLLRLTKRRRHRSQRWKRIRTERTSFWLFVDCTEHLLVTDAHPTSATNIYTQRAALINRIRDSMWIPKTRSRDNPRITSNWSVEGFSSRIRHGSEAF